MDAYITLHPDLGHEVFSSKIILDMEEPRKQPSTWHSTPRLCVFSVGVFTFSLLQWTFSMCREPDSIARS